MCVYYVYVCVHMHVMSLYALAVVLSCAAKGLTPGPHVPLASSYTFVLDSAAITNKKIGGRIVELKARKKESSAGGESCGW